MWPGLVIQDSTLFMGWVCWFSTLTQEPFAPEILPLPTSSHFIWFHFTWFSLTCSLPISRVLQSNYFFTTTIMIIIAINMVIIIVVIVHRESSSYSQIPLSLIASQWEVQVRSTAYTKLIILTLHIQAWIEEFTFPETPHCLFSIYRFKLPIIVMRILLWQECIVYRLSAHTKKLNNNSTHQTKVLYAQ